MHELSRVRSGRTRVVVVIAAVAIACAAIAAWLFPRALPLVALEQKLTREAALARADSFFRAHDLAPADARTAVRFQGNDSLRTFVELAGGGPDSLNALVRGQDVAPFTWSVRAFKPFDPRESRVDFAPDGRVLGFERTLAEEDRRPALAPDSAQRLATSVLSDWIGEPVGRWRVAATSYETRKGSGRIDRSFTFERTDRRVAGAPIRLEVVIAGDLPSRARRYVEIPEAFQRRYGEMRSANELFALVASLGALALAIAGALVLYRYARERRVRWREAFLAGGVVGTLALLAGLNEMPGSWYHYDTAMSPGAFQLISAVTALATGAITLFLVAFTLAAAEVVTRYAFPGHLDWWKLWKYRGTREVAGRVAGGYAVAAIAFAYVATFYLVTRTLFGWWVPSEVLDDPNQIASPMPWISGIAVSLNAGVWEEALFRALPLALLALWARNRPRYRWWMAGGVVLSALIFGFAHANYASWPPYSRGVEIFLDAAFWAVLFLLFGLLVTVIAHFVYDLVLFGLFAASGSAIEYRVTAAIILLAMLAPALIVLWRWVRQRGFIEAPPDAYFAAWASTPTEEPVAEAAPTVGRTLTPNARRLAVVAAVIGVIAAIGTPDRPALGPEFTADRAQVLRVADSLVRDRGVDPSAWKRLATTASDTLAAWPRFLREHDIVKQASAFATSYHPPAWWVVRYVRTEGTAAERAEEWRVRLWPDGRVLDARHIIPEAARRDTVSLLSARSIAATALARAGVDTSKLKQVDLKETPRPARRDVTVIFADTSAGLPAGAEARAWVEIAGNEPLVARRGIELPQSFLRADRDRQTTRSLIAGFCALALIGGIVTGAVIVIRRRAPPLHDGQLSRRAMVVLATSIAVLALVSRLNAFPSALFGYDTTEPWSRFLGATLLSLVVVIPLSLFVLGMWMVLTALRRRVGIPMLHGAPSRTTSNEVLLAGLGLGSLVYTANRLVSLAPRDGMPRTPGTLLDMLVPMLGNAAELPGSTLTVVAIAGIPILVITALTQRRWVRWLLGALTVALVAGVTTATAPPSSITFAGVALLLLAAALAIAAFRTWGALSAWAWLVAALVNRALGSIHGIVREPTSPEKVSEVVTLIVAIGLIAVIARHVRGKVGTPEPSPFPTATAGANV